MSSERKNYEFDGFRLDVDDKTLWRGKEKIPLPLKAMEMLTLLVENRGRTVTKEEILETLWQDTFVDENNLAVTVSSLRKVFGESKNENRFIETVPRRGYRFVADAVETRGSLILEKQTITEITIEKEEIAKKNLSQKIGILAALGIFVLITGGILAYWMLKPVPQQTVSEPEKTVVPASLTVAVLPFRNLTQDEKDEFLCLGLTDAVISKLASINKISVRSTSAVLPLGDSPTPQLVSEKLQVQNVVEGTFQRIKNRLRITVQLVHLPGNQVVWAKSIEEDDSDLLKIQETISDQIANSLLPNLSQDEKMLLARNETKDDEAFALYLKGQYYLTKRSGYELQTALNFFQQAKAKDSNFSLAYIGIARVYLIMGDSGWGLISPREAVEKSRPELEKGLQLNPNSAEAVSMLGTIQLNFDWDINKAEQTLQQAIKLNQNLSTPHHQLAWLRIAQENYADAEIEFQTAQRLEPSSSILHTEQGYPAFFAKNYAEAEKKFRAGLEFDPNSVPARFNLWRVLLHQKKNEEAMSEIGRIEAVIGKNVPLLLVCKARTLHQFGKAAEAENIYLSLKDNKTVSPLFMAILTAELGKIDESFAFLEKSLAERNDYLLHLVHAPEFENLKSDGRFKEIAQKIGSGFTGS